MPPGLRKLALSAHVAFSVSWLGAVAAFLALAIAGLASEAPERVRSSYVAMDVVAIYVLLPVALASLASGIVQSLGTSWGLMRHYWVTIKLAVTVLALVVLLLQMGSISDLADAAANSSVMSPRYDEARTSLVVHAGGGLAVLLVPLALSIYKPRGVTAYGRRSQLRER